MRVKYFTSAIAAVTFSTLAITSHADYNNPNNNPNNAGQNWGPSGPQNMYWQTPNFSFPGGSTAPPSYNRPPMPQHNPGYRQPPRPAYNNAAPNINNQAYNPPPMNNQRPNPSMGNHPNMNHPAPNMMNRGYPPPRGPYGPDNGASAYNMPGYHRYQNNGWNNNKFWGRSGPSTWMNPNKRNMEQGWDDMINAPSRMGEMPGGWSAPEVSMPNPIDMGDQMQDNVKDLPEQIRNMNVGNEVQ